MGFLDKIRKPAAAPLPEPEFVRTYESMKRFKGTRRIYVTVHGDREAEKNAAATLGNKDEHLCVGSEITLTGFRYDSGSGIKVAVDGRHLGVAWGDDGPVYTAAYDGRITGTFVKIERDGGRAKVYLFVKMPE